MKKRYFGIVALILGFVMIFLSGISYTGAAFGIQSTGNTAVSLMGMCLIFCSMLFMASGGLERKIKIHNIINDSKKPSKRCRASRRF